MGNDTEHAASQDVRHNYRCDNIDLRVEEGPHPWNYGRNGAGKTTALNAILGLTSYEENLKVLGREPFGSSRDELMRDVSFIADGCRAYRVGFAFAVARLRRRRASAFDRAKAESFLAKDDDKRTKKVRELFDGHGAQVALALVMLSTLGVLVLGRSRRLPGHCFASSSTITAKRLFQNRRPDDVVTTHQWKRCRTFSRISCSSTASDRARVQYGRIRGAAMSK